MDICEVVGKRLRELRKLKGLSQEKMAEQAGVNAKYYSEIERGKRNITLKVMEKIADNLGITLEELFRFPARESLLQSHTPAPVARCSVWRWDCPRRRCLGE